MANTAYSFTPTTTDPSGGPLSFTIAKKPTWATFNASTGQLSGTATPAGSYGNIVISVSDGTNSASLNAFTITVTQTVASAALCQGLISGKQLVSYTAMPKPAKGVPVTDPDFGTTITRITDVQGDWGGQYAVPVYPTVAAWNIDESYLLLYVGGSSQGNYALLDGKTYAFIEWLPVLDNAADIEQWDWDASDPDLIWFINSKVLTRYHVSSGVSDTIYTFSSPADWGDDPIYYSWNGQLFGLREQSTHTILSYNLTTGESVHLSTSAESPEACPSGTCLFWNSTNAGQGVLLNPTTMTSIRNISLNTMEHGDLGEDAAGNDLWAAVQFNDAPGGASGALMVEWLKTGVVKTIFGDAAGDPYPPTGTLISAKALKAPGWFVVAPTGNTALVPSYQDQEIMLGNADTGQTCRVAHHRTTGENGKIGYFAQPNVTFSPSGTRIAFPSDWNAGGGAGTTVDTYIVNLPTYTP